MQKNQLTIPLPCDMPWNKMEGAGATRACAQCEKQVHHLSLMTRQEVSELLAREESPCIRYACDAQTQEVLFRDSSSLTARLYRQGQGLAKLLATAALILPLLAGCEDPHAGFQAPVAVSPIQADPLGNAVLRPGAGKLPDHAGKQEDAFDASVDKVAPVEEVEGELEAYVKEGAEEPVAEDSCGSPKEEGVKASPLKDEVRAELVVPIEPAAVRELMGRVRVVRRIAPPERPAAEEKMGPRMLVNP